MALSVLDEMKESAPPDGTDAGTARDQAAASGPSARVIRDSLSPQGVRLTTVEVRMHRFVLSEFNTHRVFSRNSASSRAIPVRKTVRLVAEDPALPVSWPGEQSGMQGGTELGSEPVAEARRIWLAARDQAIAAARSLGELGVHKSVTNRLLEPFMWHTVIVTSTSWDNFFELRCSPLAQAEIRAAAEAVREAVEGSSPSPVAFGGWHLPYLREEDLGLELGQQIMVSSARCARVSYLTHDGRRDVEKDLALYRRLTDSSPPHLSPLEHVATPCPHPPTDHLHLGNFQGWDQLRHLSLGL